MSHFVRQQVQTCRCNSLERNIKTVGYAQQNRPCYLISAATLLRRFNNRCIIIPAQHQNGHRKRHKTADFSHVCSGMTTVATKVAV